MSTAINPAPRRCLLVASLVSIASASVLLPAEGWAQDAPTAAVVVAGTKVRLSAPSAIQGPVEGTVMEIDDQSVLLSTANSKPLRVPRQTVTHLEVSTGRHGHALRGLIIGAAAGVAVGAVMAVDALCTSVQISANDTSCMSRGESMAVGAFSYGAAGALIGHLIKSESWTAVTAGHIDVRLAPTDRRGARVAITATW